MSAYPLKPSSPLVETTPDAAGGAPAAAARPAVARPKAARPGKRRGRQAYTAAVALACGASVVVAIDAQASLSSAEGQKARGAQWRQYTRSSRAHRRLVQRSYRRLLVRYNRLVSAGSSMQRQMLAQLATARAAAEAASANLAAPTSYQTQLSGGASAAPGTAGSGAAAPATSTSSPGTTSSPTSSASNATSSAPSAAAPSTPTATPSAPVSAPPAAAPAAPPAAAAPSAPATSPSTPAK